MRDDGAFPRAAAVEEVVKVVRICMYSAGRADRIC